MKRRLNFRFVKSRGKFFKERIDKDVDSIISDEEIYDHYNKQGDLEGTSTENLQVKANTLTKKERRAAKKLDKKLLKVKAKKDKRKSSVENERDSNVEEISINEEHSSFESFWVHMICATGRFIRRWLCVPKQEDPDIQDHPHLKQEFEEIVTDDVLEADPVKNTNEQLDSFEELDMEETSNEDAASDAKKYLENVDLMIHEADSLDDILADIEPFAKKGETLSDNDSSGDDVPIGETDQASNFLEELDQHFNNEFKTTGDEEKLVVGFRRNKKKQRTSGTSECSSASSSKCDEEHDSSYAITTTTNTSPSATIVLESKRPEDMFVPLSDDEVDEGIEEEFYNPALNCIVKTMPVKKKRPMFREIQLQNPVEDTRLPPVKTTKKPVTFEVGHDAKAQEWLITKRIPENIREKLRTPDRRERVFSRNEIDMKMIRAEEKRLKMLEVKKKKTSQRKLDKTMLEKMEEERRMQLKIHLDKKMDDAVNKREERTEIIKTVSWYFNIVCQMIFELIYFKIKVI